MPGSSLEVASVLECQSRQSPLDCSNLNGLLVGLSSTGPPHWIHTYYVLSCCTIYRASRDDLTEKAAKEWSRLACWKTAAWKGLEGLGRAWAMIQPVGTRNLELGTFPSLLPIVIVPFLLYVSTSHLIPLAFPPGPIAPSHLLLWATQPPLRPSSFCEFNLFLVRHLASLRLQSSSPSHHAFRAFIDALFRISCSNRPRRRLHGPHVSWRTANLTAIRITLEFRHKILSSSVDADGVFVHVRGRAAYRLLACWP